MLRQFKVFSIFAPHWLSAGLQAVKAPSQYAVPGRHPEDALWEEKLCVQHGLLEELLLPASPKARRDMEGGLGREGIVSLASSGAKSTE